MGPLPWVPSLKLKHNEKVKKAVFFLTSVLSFHLFMSSKSKKPSKPSKATKPKQARDYESFSEEDSFLGKSATLSNEVEQPAMKAGAAADKSKGVCSRYLLSTQK
jgi:hypothetical protein